MLLTCLYTARVAGGPCYTILAKKIFLSAFFFPPWHLQQRSTAHPPKILQTPLGARGNCSDHSVPAAARWRWNCLLQWSRCNTNRFFFSKHTHTRMCTHTHMNGWCDVLLAVRKNHSLWNPRKLKPCFGTQSQSVGRTWHTVVAVVVVVILWICDQIGHPVTSEH